MQDWLQTVDRRGQEWLNFNGDKNIFHLYQRDAVGQVQDDLLAECFFQAGDVDTFGLDAGEAGQLGG